MTALPEYQLLEATGLYADREGAVPEDVLLCFGAASLTIMRFDETPIAHWPLASLRAVGREGAAVILAPDPSAPERLSVSDPQMVDALRAVSAAFESGPRPAPRPRGLRRLAVAAAILLALGAALWQAGPSLRDRAAENAPPPLRAALGEAAVAAYAGGALCAPGARTRRALDALAARLDRAAPARLPRALRVVDLEGPALAVAAPGGRIALSAPRMADVETAEPILRALALAAAQAEADPPLAAALRALGPAGALSDLGALAAALVAGDPPRAPRLAEAAASRMTAPRAGGASVAARAEAIMRELGKGGPALDRSSLALIRSACAGR